MPNDTLHPPCSQCTTTTKKDKMEAQSHCQTHQWYWYNPFLRLNRRKPLDHEKEVLDSIENSKRKHETKLTIPPCRQTKRKSPINHIEYLPLTIEQDNNQPNGKKRTDSSIKSQSTMALHRKGENGSIFPILIDVPMKPQQPIQHLPCVLYSMPTIWSKRINEKDGET